MTLGIIIQARMGSTRLPGKVLRMMGDKPLLARVLDRLTMLKTPATIIVATATTMQDNAIADWCKKNSIACFRGSEENVLDRYYQCANQHGFTQIIRLTADNPFTDTEELDRLIALHLSEGNDYSHSFGQLPIGVGAEILTIAALERSHQHGTATHHREHVNEYIIENPALFHIGTLKIPAEKTAPTLRLTIDTEDDFNHACTLMLNSEDTELSTQTVIRKCSLSA